MRSSSSAEITTGSVESFRASGRLRELSMMRANTKNYPTTSSWSKFNANALFDLGVVVGTLVVVKQIFLPHTFLYAGPISTFSTMIVATYLLHRRDVRWSDLGLVWPKRWLHIAGLTGLTIVVFAVFFGYRHYYYQGMHGALVTDAAGLAFAGLYLWFGRRFTRARRNSNQVSPPSVSNPHSPHESSQGSTPP